MTTPLSFLKFKKALAVLALCFLTTSAFAQTEDPDTPNDSQDVIPCNITIEGNFESSCVLPLDKDSYYNETPDELLACQGMTVKYTAYADLGGNAPEGWHWEVAGAASYSDHGNGSITVTWSKGTSGQLTVTVYGPNGVSCSKTVNVHLIEKPQINVVSTPAYIENLNGRKFIYVCKGETVEFTDLSSSTNTDIVGYYWESRIGGTSSTPNYKIENVWMDDKVIHRVYNNCGCYDEEVYEIRLKKGEPLELECYGTVCEGAIVTYKALNPPCSDYLWYVEGGTIMDGQHTPDVTVQWDNPQNGYGIIALDGNQCGEQTCPTMLSRKIPIIENNLPIKGQTNACVGEAVIYSIPLFGSTEYRWTISPSSGVAPEPVNGANEQMYIFNQPGTYQISVAYKCEFLDCGEFQSDPLTVVVKPKLSIKGEDRICISNPCNLSTSPSVSATWRVYDMDHNNQFVASYPSLANLSVTLPHPGKYRITAENSNYCRVAEFVLNVQDAPPAPTLSDLDPANPHTSCLKSGILLKASPSNSNYTFIWEPECNSGFPPSISGNEVTINYNTAVCNVAVYTYDRVLGCRSENAYIHTVTERLPQPLNITPPVTVCPGTMIEWDDSDVPNQEGFLYKWKIQDDMQHCASVQGNALSNAITLAVNNHTSGIYPVNFYVTLERRYCDLELNDTIPIIVQGQDSVDISITQDHDTVCPGTEVTFTGHGGDATVYKWKVDDDNQEYDGATFSHTFYQPGYHTVILKYSVLDYCTNTQYFASETTQVFVLQPPISENSLFLNTSDNTVSVSVPDPNNYSFAWYYEDNLLPYATDDIIVYRGLGCYKCIITDNTTGCTNTIITCFYVPSPQCTPVGWDDFSYDPCTATLHLETQVNGNPVEWAINGGHCSITYLNDSHSEMDITFKEAMVYYITAQSSGNNCERSDTFYNVTFIPKFTFEKKCNKIIIHNHSKYRNGNTPIQMTVNGQPISFLAHDASYTYPISTNGSYTFQLTQPYNCSLGTVVFDTYNDEELTITASNGSDPIRTCDNTPLLLTATLASGTPISSTMWRFSDGTYFKEEGNTFNHTFADKNTSYTVTAEVLDQNGCLVTASVSLKSFENRVERGYLLSTGFPVCPYVASKDVTFTSQNSWFNASTSNYQWNIGNYPTLPTRPTYFTANYIAVVTDVNFCKEHAQKDVVFKTRPTAIIVAEANKGCVGDKIKIYGAPGPDSNDYVFEWDIKDPNGIHTIPTSATVTLDASIVGTYEINLHLTNNQGCTADASTVYITIYPTPAAPTIGFGARECLNDPPVELVGNTPANTNFHWSNGSTGSHAYYFNPGVATAWYYDPASGCKSEEANIAIEAQPNFDALLTGCYEKCPPFFNDFWELPVWGLTQYQQVIQWDWYHDGYLYDSGTGNYTNNPLWLKLDPFGQYYLDVIFNNYRCSSKSPFLTIKEKEICDCEDVDISTELNWYVKECRLYYDIIVTVCNNSIDKIEDCFTELIPLFDQQYVRMTYTDFTATSINSGDCFSFKICLEVERFMPPQTATFQLYDECNNCTTNFSIDLMPDKFECEDMMTLVDFKAIEGMTNNSTVYLDFSMDVSPCQHVLAFWSEPPMIVDYWYDGVNMVQGLIMLDYAKITQLMNEDGVICFYAITCEEDKLCKRYFCIPAKEIYKYLQEMGITPNNVPVGGEGNSTEMMTNLKIDNSASPKLMPNPTTGEVTVVVDKPTSGNNGMADEIIEVVVMDMNGRKVATFDNFGPRSGRTNTATFNIANHPSGPYIVRVKTKHDKDEKITYLKLVKK